VFYLGSGVYPDHMSVWTGTSTSVLMSHSKVGGLIAVKTHTNYLSHFRMTPNTVAVAPPAKYCHVE